MNWKVKAFIQNCIASFPKAMSYKMYFQMQRHFGEFKKKFNPSEHFLASVKMLRKIKQYKNDINEKIFFEVGTGRVPVLPIAFWLCGAGKIITMDLNPYMRNELIKDMLLFCRNQQNEIKNIFGELLDKERFNLLLDFSEKNKIDKKDILKLCKIEYIAPGDVTKTNLPKNSIHYHISHTVYEHIPLNVIHDILKEGNRILVDNGLFINDIDYGDHFSYMDKNISAINFLQYSDKKWEKYAGNLYMYTNRARHDDFVELFKAVGHDFLEIEPHFSKAAEEILRNNEIVLDTRFKNKSNEILSVTNSLFVTRKGWKK
jgi:SAM-dependent methyltransferase